MNAGRRRSVAPSGTVSRYARPPAGPAADYEYEPSPSAILDTLVPRYVGARTYAAFLNAAASEHAFRQRALKAATDNADELIKTLSRIMNRARQDSITTEIMEIVGGAEALAGGDRDSRARVALDLVTELELETAPLRGDAP